MANRRQKKNGSKNRKNQPRKENRTDFGDELKNRGKKDGFPTESSGFIVKSIKGNIKSGMLSDIQSKIIPIIEEGLFGRKVEATSVIENRCLITEEIRVDAHGAESWKGKKYSSNRLEKFAVSRSSITRRYRKSIKLKAISLLKDFKRNLKMEEFSFFNNISKERLNYCFAFENINRGKLNLNKTLFISESLKNPLSNVIFENIIKKDGLILLNKEMDLTYHITFKNANPSLSQENIYFTLNCIECNYSTFTCQSLDSLFSFKTSNNRLCETYKNQQNYLSLIYNGCFFPTLKVKSCPKCSPIKVDDNIKTNFLSCSPIEGNKNLKPTVSFSQINTSKWIRDLNSFPTEKDFFLQETLNNCHSRIHENNSYEENASDQGNSFLVFEPSNLSASPDSFKCYSSTLCACNSACNYSNEAESIQISNPYGAYPNFAPFINKICNCTGYANYNTTDVPIVENQNLCEEFLKDDMHSEEVTPNEEAMISLSNLNSGCCYLCFPNIKTESERIISNERMVSDESFFCSSNSNCISDIYPQNTNNLSETEWNNSKELGNLNESSTYSDFNKTAKNVFVEDLNQELDKSSYQNLENSDYYPGYKSPNQNSPSPINNPNTCYAICSYPNQTFNGTENQISCSYCRDYESKLQNWNCFQCLLSSNKNSCNDIRYKPNIFIPIPYSDDRETIIPEVKLQNINFGYLHGYEEMDFVKRKSIVSDPCILQEADEETDGVSYNREEVQMCTNEKHSNVTELRRENQLIPKIGSVETGVPSYVNSYNPSYAEKRNSASEYELPTNDLININLSNLQPYNNYNHYSNSSSNVVYNSYPGTQCENENFDSQIFSSTLDNTENFSFYEKEKYNSCRSYKTTSDTFYNSNVSRFPNECIFAFHQYTKHKGIYYKNGINSSTRSFRNNYEYLNINKRSGESWKSFNYNQKRNFFQSSSEVSRKFYGYSSQKNKRQESYIPNYHKKFSFSPSKSNLFKSRSRGKFSSYGYENKRFKDSYRGAMNSPQENFFNAAANPNSYT